MATHFAIGAQLERLLPKFRDLRRPVQRLRQLSEDSHRSSLAPGLGTEKKVVGALHIAAKTGLPHNDKGLKYQLNEN